MEIKSKARESYEETYREEIEENERFDKFALNVKHVYGIGVNEGMFVKLSIIANYKCVSGVRRLMRAQYIAIDCKFVCLSST